jgi:hypothetical protein
MSWCRNNLGINKRKLYELNIRVVKNTESKDECGQYEAEWNEIEIYWNNMLNVKEIIETCIHEWSHYRQPIRSQYFKWKGPYSKNPYEVEARKNEKIYTPICWNEIKSKVNRNRLNK